MSQLLSDLRRKAAAGRLTDKVDYCLVRFAWASGCRSSEIASLSQNPTQPNWIDLQTGLVTITDAKWDSKGTIPLDAASLRILRHYVREVRPLLRNASVMHQLFITKTGSPYSPNTMTKKLRLVLARYGLAGKSAHSFRHHYCTDLFRRGAALHEVKALLRHRDVRSTMAYSHASIDDLRAVVNRRLS
jgi:site-specific recombinase XerD